MAVWIEFEPDVCGFLFFPSLSFFYVFLMYSCEFYGCDLHNEAVIDLSLVKKSVNSAVKNNWECSIVFAAGLQ